MPQATPIPAATLIVARDRPDGPPDLLMVERSGQMAFAPGALVFPGGRIDPADIELGTALGIEHGAGIVAAIRETIEETAVPVGLEPCPAPAQALVIQEALLGGRSLAEELRAHSLKLKPAGLTLFTHWLPKFHATRRFDTLFFIAPAPAGPWEPQVGERENRTAEWLSAAEALRRDAAGEAALIFPTRCTLRRLAQHRSFAEIELDAAAHPVRCVTPWIEERDGERWLTIPADLGFPVTQERIDGLWRG